MAVILPTTNNTWSSTRSDYTTSSEVFLDGVLYQGNADTIAAGTNPKTSNDWKVIAVHTIQDYNSLIEAVRLQLNTDDSEIERSAPVFIQLAEESFKTRIRVPQQRKRVVLSTDSQSRVEAPGDLLEVINLRQNSDAATGGTLDIRARGVIEILNGNYEEYQRLLRFNSSDNFIGVRDFNAFDAPLYWFDSRYFNIAPEYDEGTEMELWYYSTIPQLGTTVSLTDTSGNPIDSSNRRIPSSTMTFSFTEDTDGGTPEEGEITIAASTVIINGTDAENAELLSLLANDQVRLNYESTNTLFTLSGNAFTVGDTVRFSLTSPPAQPQGNNVQIQVTPASVRTQATQVIEENWFTAAAPQMLYYGALVKAEHNLKDPEMTQFFQQEFEKAQAETQDMINRFENSQPHTIFVENTYSSRI